MRPWLALLIGVGCGARSELSTVMPHDAATDASSPTDAPISHPLPDVAAPVQPTVVAAFDVPAYAITVDETNVYWTLGYMAAPLNGPAFPVAMQCDKSSCATPTVLASGVDFPLSIAVDHEYVYWSSKTSGNWTGDGGLVGCAIGGCAQSPQLFVNANVHSIVAQEAHLFWSADSSIDECLVGGCAGTSTTFASSLSGMVTDGTYAYWNDANFMRCPFSLTGCNAPPVMIAPGAPGTPSMIAPNFGAFAVDAMNIYWQTAGAIMRSPKDGSSPPTVLMPTQANEVQCIASDGVNVYWTAPSALVQAMGSS